MQIARVDLNLIRDAFGFRISMEVGATAQFTQNAPRDIVRRLRDAHDEIIAMLSNRIIADA